MTPLTKTIESKAMTPLDPWRKAAAKTYMDELLRPEFADRQVRLAEGPNWMRIVPASASESETWMLGLHVLATATGKFAHPRTFLPAARGVWDSVYSKLRKDSPGKLYSRENRDGLIQLFDKVSGHWSYEDPVYRFYHQSFEVFALQETIREIVTELQALLPGRGLNLWFLEIVEAGTGHQFDMSCIDDWRVTRIPFWRRSFMRVSCWRWPCAMRILRSRRKCFPADGRRCSISMTFDKTLSRWEATTMVQSPA